ncbi:MAG: TetR/AcrR family transcriptional regulator [Burkholderiaceae bacterium]
MAALRMKPKLSRITLRLAADVMLVNMESDPPRRSARRPATSKAGYHHGDLPRALVAAATRLIESPDRGPVTLRAAAVASGVSIAAPYRHFKSRDALLAAVLAEGFRELERRTESTRQAEANPLRALEAVGATYVRFAVERPRLYRMMFGPDCDKARFPELLRAGREALAVLHRAVSQARASLGIGEGEVARVALAGWSLVHGLASLHVDGMLAGAGHGFDPEQVARDIASILIDGLRARSRAEAAGCPIVSPRGGDGER